MFTGCEQPGERNHVVHRGDQGCLIRLLNHPMNGTMLFTDQIRVAWNRLLNPPMYSVLNSPLNCPVSPVLERIVPPTMLFAGQIVRLNSLVNRLLSAYMAYVRVRRYPAHLYPM